MAQNVEIKARLDDITIQRRLVAGLSDFTVRFIKQKDYFLHARQGRLKLRLFENGSGQLISYVRKNQTGPKISEYNIYETADPHSLLAVLEKSHGIRGVVEKSRELYHCGKTRIHLDQVYDLGDFLELEVVLGEHEDRRAGEKEAAELMKKLQISEDNLVADAYIDLLEKTS